eukprot:2071153-Pyramimonas_sp.AAC.1
MRPPPRAEEGRDAHGEQLPDRGGSRHDDLDDDRHDAWCHSLCLRRADRRGAWCHDFRPSRS